MDALRIIAWVMSYPAPLPGRRHIMIVGTSLVAFSVLDEESERMLWKANIFRTRELAHENAVMLTANAESVGMVMSSGPYTRMNDIDGLLKALRMKIKNPGPDDAVDLSFRTAIQRGLSLETAVDPDWVKAYI